MALPMVCWVCPMHQTMVPGRLSANILATLNICSSVTPQASCTLSGVHLAITSAFTASIP